MEITSPAFKNNDFIPSKYTCDGEDVNPAFSIEDVPKEAKSLALIIDDPDAPAGTWNHWTIWNIQPSITKIKEDSVPEGAIQGTNDFSKQSYGGPCPPSGIHNYHFKLYALDRKLKLNSSSKKEEVEKAIEGHILKQAKLIGKYKK